MENNKIAQIVVLVLIVGAGVWWYTSSGSSGNKTEVQGVGSIAPVSVSDEFAKTNPFDGGKVDPLSGYTNPFEK